MMDDRDWWQRDGSEHYREVASKLRDIARNCRFPGARQERSVNHPTPLTGPPPSA